MLILVVTMARLGVLLVLVLVLERGGCLREPRAAEVVVLPLLPARVVVEEEEEEEGGGGGGGGRVIAC
jgi:hypothetical protein